jgi:type I restriction enzyme, S subunit
MKEGWQTATLSEVCQIRPPKSEARDRVSVASLVSFLPMEDMGVDEKFVKGTQTKRLSAVVGSYTYFADGDVLLAKITPCFENGKLGIAEGLTNGIGFGSSEYVVFRPKQTVSKEWLYYFLSREAFRTEGATRMTGAVGHKRVSKEFIESYLIPVPPISEQQRIVGLLDEAFEDIATAKANAERNLQNARAIFESHLNSVLLCKKWQKKTLGDVCENVEYGSSTKSKKQGKVPVLRMGNIQDGKLDWDNLVYSDNKAEIEKYLLKHNDVLFNRTNSPELVGKTAIYKSEMPAIFAGYLIRIHRKENLLDADYLNYFLNSQIALDYGKTVVISSVNQANINGTKLKGYPIPLPSISEQRTIVKKLDGLQQETQHIANIYERKLAALEALKTSLLHQAFTGGL